MGNTQELDCNRYTQGKFIKIDAAAINRRQIYKFSHSLRGNLIIIITLYIGD